MTTDVMHNVQGPTQRMTAFFADQDVGFEAVRYVLESFPEHLKCVVTVNNNEIAELARSFGCQIYYYEEINEKNAEIIFGEVDIIFLAWWPKIIHGYLINAPKVGVVNFHPSLLPYNRGKHYNFWTIVENTPFGVSLHFVDEGIDSGDIVFQSSIEKTWEDTGETLYKKAKAAMGALFKARYLDIVMGRYKRAPQDLSQGQIHYSKELNQTSRIKLDQFYRARDLINLLRARTFKGKPSCYFDDSGKKYEVTISIKEVTDE